MTTSRNPSARDSYPRFPLAIDVTTDQNINEGDLVYWDGVNGTLKPLTDPDNVAISGSDPFKSGFVGVAVGSNLSGGTSGTPPVYPSPAGTTSEQLSNVEVQRNGSVYMFTTAGETYTNFMPVTVGATSQTITMIDDGAYVTSTSRVGFALVPAPLVGQGAASSTPLLETIVGTGQLIEVWLEPKFPGTTVV